MADGYPCTVPEPSHRREPPPGRGAARAAAAAAAGILAIGALGCGPAESTSPAVGTGALHGAGRPVGVASLKGRAWVVDRVTLRVHAVGREGGTSAPGVMPSVPRAAFAVGITAAGGRLWAAYAHPVDRRGWLAVVDPRTGRTRVLPVGAAPVAISTAGAGVLVVGRDGSLWRARDGRVRRIVAGAKRVRSADQADTVWILTDTGVLQRFGSARGVQLGPGAPRAVVAGSRGVWVSGGCGRSLAWLASGARRVACTPVAARILDAWGRTAWAVEGRSGLVRLRDGTPVGRCRLPFDPTAVAAGPRGVWLSSETGAVLRVTERSCVAG